MPNFFVIFKEDSSIFRDAETIIRIKASNLEEAAHLAEFTFPDRVFKVVDRLPAGCNKTIIPLEGKGKEIGRDNSALSAPITLHLSPSQVWLSIFAAVAAATGGKYADAIYWADQGLDDFTTRFPFPTQNPKGAAK